MKRSMPHGKRFLPARQPSADLPARPGGCLFNAGHEAMNEPKEDSAGRRERGEALIYVVDDEPMLLELASVILEPLGYPVETFRSPETALRAFELAEPKPALIITDYAMHAMNGLELAEPAGGYGQSRRSSWSAAPSGRRSSRCAGPARSFPGQALSGEAAHRSSGSGAGGLAGLGAERAVQRD